MTQAGCETLIRFIFSAHIADFLINTFDLWYISLGCLSLFAAALKQGWVYWGRLKAFDEVSARAFTLGSKTAEYDHKYQEIKRELDKTQDVLDKLTKVIIVGSFIFVSAHTHPRIPICQKCWYESKNQVELVFSNKYTVNLKVLGTVVLRSLSAQLGFPEKSIHNWFSGKNIPNSALAVFLDRGCNLHWLLTGEGEMLRSESLPQLPAGLSPEKLREVSRQLSELADRLEQQQTSRD